MAITWDITDCDKQHRSWIKWHLQTFVCCIISELGFHALTHENINEAWWRYRILIDHFEFAKVYFEGEENPRPYTRYEFNRFLGITTNHYTFADHRKWVERCVERRVMPAWVLYAA